METPKVKRLKSKKPFICKSFGTKFWFLNYKWKENLSGDLMAGATMAIIQIPQGTNYDDAF